MDGFVSTNNPGGARAMGYYTEVDLPYYYWMAKTFSISDRHFCSLLGPTWPNRFYFYGASSWGNTKTGDVGILVNDEYQNATKIMDQMETAGKTWKIYRDGSVSFAIVFGPSTANYGTTVEQFETDVDNDALPNLAIIDPSFTGAGQNDEHPPANVQLGQQFAARILNKLMSNPTVWSKTVFILFYDEHGGFYDHVPPPPACEPDNHVPPDYKFDRLGIRTPLIVASPFVKKGYVSHFVTDITSVTRFIQNRFDLPAMTRRDANAWPMLDMFDFDTPPHATAPSGAPDATANPAGVQFCANNAPGTGKP
jgi:phospholipase C